MDVEYFLEITEQNRTDISFLDVYKVHSDNTIYIHLSRLVFAKQCLLVCVITQLTYCYTYVYAACTIILFSLEVLEIFSSSLGTIFNNPCSYSIQYIHGRCSVTICIINSLSKGGHSLKIKRILQTSVLQSLKVLKEIMPMWNI